jgi:hypothetical protein
MLLGNSKKHRKCGVFCFMGDFKRVYWVSLIERCLMSKNQTERKEVTWKLLLILYFVIGLGFFQYNSELANGLFVFVWRNGCCPKFLSGFLLPHVFVE